MIAGAGLWRGDHSVIRLPLSGDVQNPIIVAHNARLEAVDKRRLKSVRMATGWSRDCNRSLLATGLLSSKVTDQTHFRRITFVQKPSRNTHALLQGTQFGQKWRNQQWQKKTNYLTKKAAKSKAVFYPGTACHSILTLIPGGQRIFCNLYIAGIVSFYVGQQTSSLPTFFNTRGPVPFHLHHWRCQHCPFNTRGPAPFSNRHRWHHQQVNYYSDQFWPRWKNRECKLFQRVISLSAAQRK